MVQRILIMILAYSGYVLAIALLDGSRAAGAHLDRAPEAHAYVAGRRIWREQACQTCHSIYGLGGHAGPDLTNAIRRIPDSYFRQVVLNGHRGMPAFDVTAGELQGLIDYLAFIGETGVYPPDSIQGPVFGAAP